VTPDNLTELECAIDDAYRATFHQSFISLGGFRHELERVKLSFTRAEILYCGFLGCSCKVGHQEPDLYAMGRRFKERLMAGEYR